MKNKIHIFDPKLKINKNLQKVLSFGGKFVVKKDRKSEIKLFSKKFPTHPNSFPNKEGYVAKFKKEINLRDIKEFLLSNIVKNTKKMTDYDKIHLKIQHILSNKMPKLLKYNLVLETDKNMGIIVFPRDKYSRLCLNQLEDPRYYEEIKETPHNIIAWFSALFQYHKLWDLIKPTYDSIAHFEGLPKIHKTPIKMRPIIRSSRIFTTNLNKHLHQILSLIHSLLVEHFKEKYWVVINSQQVMNKLRKINRSKNLVDLGETQSFDFVAMYTNIRFDELIKRMNYLLNWVIDKPVVYNFHEISEEGRWIDKELIISKGDIINLIKISVEFNYISFENRIFKSTKGIAMGSNASPLLANIYLASYEIEACYNNDLIAKFFKSSCRYIDDLLLVNNSFARSIDLKKDIYNNQMDLEISKPDWDLAIIFLDLRIFVSPNLKYRWELYRKPNNSYEYPHALSYQPMGVKKGFIIGGNVKDYQKHTLYK